MGKRAERETAESLLPRERQSGSVFVAWQGDVQVEQARRRGATAISG